MYSQPNNEALESLNKIKIEGVGLRNLLKGINKAITEYGKPIEYKIGVNANSVQAVARVALHMLENQLAILVRKRAEEIAALSPKEPKVKYIRKVNY